MKRYNLQQLQGFGKSVLRSVKESPNGDYVLYDDIKDQLINADCLHTAILAKEQAESQETIQRHAMINTVTKILSLEQQKTFYDEFNARMRVADRKYNDVNLRMTVERAREILGEDWETDLEYISENFSSNELEAFSVLMRENEK